MSYNSSVSAIHGVPRSGTSWLSQIFNSDPRVNLKFQPLFSYAFKDYLDTNSSYEKILEFYDGIWDNTEDLLMNMKDPIIHKNYPNFKKNKSLEFLVFKQVHHHYILKTFLKKDSEFKVVILIRNPLAVISSWLSSPKEFDPSWNVSDQWIYAEKKNMNKRENYFGFNKWKEATALFLDLKLIYGNRVKIVEYGDLLTNTLDIVESVFDFAGLGEIKQNTLDFIGESKLINHNDPNSVYKNKKKDDSWQNVLPQYIVEQIKNDDLFKKLNQEYNWIL